MGLLHEFVVAVVPLTVKALAKAEIVARAAPTALVDYNAKEIEDFSTLRNRYWLAICLSINGGAEVTFQRESVWVLDIFWNFGTEIGEPLKVND